MKKNLLISILITSLFLISGCQTVKNKTDAIVEKENEKLSKYIGKSLNELRLDLGKPNEDFKNEKGPMYHSWVTHIDTFFILKYGSKSTMMIERSNSYNLNVG